MAKKTFDFGIKKIKKKPPQLDNDWLLLLAYIGAKRTSEPEFKVLFNKMLNDKKHRCHKLAKELEMRYDFTELR